MTDNINENLIKHFLLEKGLMQGYINSVSQAEYQECKYREYQEGLLKINASEFMEWWEEKKDHSEQFKNFLLEEDFVLQRDLVAELTSDVSLSCISGLSESFKKQIIISPAGEGYIGMKKVELESGLLVVNGVYMNQQNYLLRVSRNNHFIAGYVEGKNQQYNEYLWNYYNRLLAIIHILKPMEKSILCPNLEWKEQGKIHVLTRKMSQAQLRCIATRVHHYKYDDDCTHISNR